MLSILKKEVKHESRRIFRQDQYGFKKGCGTREAIVVIKTLSKRNLEHNQNVYVCFVDLEKAFDRIRRYKLLEIQRNIGVEWRDRS